MGRLLLRARAGQQAQSRSIRASLRWNAHTVLGVEIYGRTDKKGLNHCLQRSRRRSSPCRRKMKDLAE